MASISVKLIKTALFGVVESDDAEIFRGVFSAEDHPVHTMDLTPEACDQVASDLGIQLPRIADDLREFVDGSYHPEADPPTGSQLGNITEALSYLLWRSSGRRITRVASYRRGDGEKDFPQPDFLVEEGGRVGALEVKSANALNAHVLRDVVGSENARHWKRLMPCAVVAARREEALRQLGYNESIQEPQLHRLVLRDSREMPFPADFGFVHVHLVRDGRLNALRTHQHTRRLKAAPECAEKLRTCWDCLDARRASEASGVSSDPAHIALVELHNAPGSLGLLGAGKKAVDWYSAYARWNEALWASDPMAAEVTQRTLVNATNDWAEGLAAENRGAADLLKVIWDQYLGEVAFSRGLHELAGRSRFDGVADGFKARSHRLTDEPNVLISERIGPDLLSREEPGRLYVVEPERDGTRGKGISFSVTPEAIEVHILSGWWWSRTPFGVEEAIQIAQNLLKAAWEATGGLEATAIHIRDGFRGITVRALDTIFIGWQFVSSGDWRAILATTEEGETYASRWMLALSMGDPRCKLIVHPDGRGYLRIARSLSALEPVRILGEI